MLIENYYLVDIGALDLTHVSKVVSDKLAIVITHSTDFIPALVCVETQFLSLSFYLLGILR